MSNEYIEVCEKFFKMEQNLELFEWKVDGIYVWELIRFDVFNLIMQNMNLYGQAHTSIAPSLRNKIKKVFSSLYNYFLKNPFFIPRKKFVFVGHQRRKLLKDGKYWDIYCDPIINEIGGDCFLLEDYHLNTHLKPAKTKSIYYLDIVNLFCYIYKKIFQKKNKFKDDSINKIKDITFKIYELFSIKIDIDLNVDNALTGFKSQCYLYDQLFKRINPKVLFVLVGYGKEALIDAAKKLLIPVVELQHGTISRYHMAYSFPNGNKKHYFADYFFTFGDFWNNVADFPIAQNNIKTMGYPYLNESLVKYQNIEKQKTIVFISQGTIGKDLSKFALELRKITPLDIDIIYKLHPGEYDRWKQTYPWLVDSDVHVVDSQSPDLYALLSTAQWQIGVYSTAIYEGLAFGCQTYLVDLPGVAYINKLIESGYAQLVVTPDEINLETKNIIVDTDYFFAHDWQENFEAAVSEIINSKRI